MPDDETREPTRSRPSFIIDPKWRSVAVGLGVLGLGAGGVATFTADVEGGPVAMLLIGLIFMLIAMRGQLPHRVKIGDNEAAWEQVGDYVADTIANAPPENKPTEIERALELADVAPEAVARGIGKVALRDASLATFRSIVENIPDVQLRRLLATTAGEVMFMLEGSDGARVLVDAPAPDQDVLTAEPVADMLGHWAVLFLIGRSDQVRFDLDTERPSAAFIYRTEGRFQRESLQELLLSLLRESQELLARE